MQNPKFLTKTLELQLQIGQDLQIKRSQLGEILLSEVSDEDKITQIRRLMLKFRTQPGSGSNPEELTKTTDDIGKNLDKFDIKDLDALQYALKFSMEPVEKFSNMLDEISTIVVSQDSVKDKITQIENLVLTN